jgi:hypothetical protein
MLRVKEGHGNQPYYPAVIAPNRTINPFYARIAGQPVLREDGVYYLRYRDRAGRRHYQLAGSTLTRRAPRALPSAWPSPPPSISFSPK